MVFEEGCVSSHPGRGRIIVRVLLQLVRTCTPSFNYTHTDIDWNISTPPPTWIYFAPFFNTLYKQEHTPLLCLPQPLLGKTSVTSPLSCTGYHGDRIFFPYTVNMQSRGLPCPWLESIRLEPLGMLSRDFALAFKIITEKQWFPLRMSIFAAALPMCCPLAYL